MLASSLFALAAASCSSYAFAQNVTPGKVIPSYPQSWLMNESTGIMICNNSGQVTSDFTKNWALVDLDWNSNKVGWSSVKPMNCEEDMVNNVLAMKQARPSGIYWVYRNGIKALPWFTSVRTKLEDPQYWGWFLPKANCSTGPGIYVCGPNATNNLYHDLEQTPKGDCGVGVECGEYLFDHRNESLRSFLLGEYFFGPNGGSNPAVNGFYVDDDWNSKSGPSEMNSSAVQEMGLTSQDLEDITNAWSQNQQLWRNALVAAGLFEWFLFYGGQQTAPGWNQTAPQDTCKSYMQTNCGNETSPPYQGALFFGFSRVTHSQAWPLPYPAQDVAAFLLSRGPTAYIGYGWTGCLDANHLFPQPEEMQREYGVPISYCSETSLGSNVYAREYENSYVSLDCNSFTSNITMKTKKP